MAIQITRGPRGDGSPVISFNGQDSNGVSASEPFSLVQVVTPQINSLNNTAVDVVHTPLTITNGYATYILYNVEYDEWLDRDGNTFASALDVVNYIRDEAAEGVSILEQRVSTPVAITTGITVYTNTQFELDATHVGGCGYFWERGSIPPQMQVSPVDRRKISGILTQTGVYGVNCEVANLNGITTTTFFIDVV